MIQDLFNRADCYPQSPAARATDTSRAAAAVVAGRAYGLRERVLDYIKGHRSTADEVAAALNESILTIRPRVCELGRMGKLADCGERRPNNSGKKAIVWAAV